MTSLNYKVAWKRKAAMKFAKLYNADHRRVLTNTNHLLSIDPYRIADGIADYPGYPFNGYLWAMISNVVIVYRVHSDQRIVRYCSEYSACGACTVNSNGYVLFSIVCHWPAPVFQFRIAFVTSSGWNSVKI